MPTETPTTETTAKPTKLLGDAPTPPAPAEVPAADLAKLTAAAKRAVAKATKAGQTHCQVEVPNGTRELYKAAARQINADDSAYRASASNYRLTLRWG
jgi:hypothetical protein